MRAREAGRLASLAKFAKAARPTGLSKHALRLSGGWAARPTTIAPVERDISGLIRAVFQRVYTRMLIITRKTGESVIVNHNIEVILVSVDGAQVRLGFKAPMEVQVHRKEVYERIQQANQESATSREKSKLPRLGKG